MHAFWSLRKDPRKHTWQLSGIFFGIFRHLLWIVGHLFWDCQAICLGSTAYFHWLGPLGRVSHRVAMSVCLVLNVVPSNAIYFEASQWPWDDMISSQASHCPPPPWTWTRGLSLRGALKQGDVQDWTRWLSPCGALNTRRCSALDLWRRGSQCLPYAGFFF